MIELASLPNFGFVAVVTMFSVSALAGGVTLAGRRSLRSLGPSIERAAAEGALLAGPLAGVGLALVLAGRSLVVLAFGLDDHCLEHPGVPHLCLRHAGDELATSPALATTVCAAIGFGTAGLCRWRRGCAGRQALDRLARIASPVAEVRGIRISCVDSSRPLCFLTHRDRSPSILVSTSVWTGLPPRDREAMVAHELAHLRHRDLERSELLAWLAIFAAPGIGSALLRTWWDASERLADRAAAVETDAGAVASALVAFAGMASAPPQPATSLAFASDGQSLARRVEAILGPAGADLTGLTRALRAGALGSMLGAAALATARADAIHQAVEHLLARI